MPYTAVRRHAPERSDPSEDDPDGPSWSRDFEFDIFMATPMSAYASDSEAYRRNRETILAIFAELKRQTRFTKFFCPAILVESAAKFDAHEQALVQDVLALEASEAFILYYMPPLPKTPSSVFVEAGMALSARIPSIYIVRSRSDLPYMLRTADQITFDRLSPGLSRRNARSRASSASSTGPVVKIIEVGDAPGPDASEIAGWFESQRRGT